MEGQTATRTDNLALLNARLQAGLSQRAMAEQIGVTERVYAHAERGGRPRPGHAAKFSEHLDIPVIDLFYPEVKSAA